MFSLRLFGFRIALVALAAVGFAACDKQGSAPGGFGVNITVDASKVPMAERAKIKTATLRALSDKAGATVVSRPVDKFAEGVQGGIVRFHYTPAATVKPGESLTFALDAFNGATIVASGSSAPVELKATAVEAKIELDSMVGDGGMTGTDGSEVGGSGKKVNGTACLEGTECDSAFCADGVCCNEKCDDVCVSCKLATSKGVCTAYAVDTDPELECVPPTPVLPPEEDAGSAPATDGAADAAKPASDGAADAAATDAAAAEVAPSDAAIIYAPDGGFMSMPKTCGGTCGGARACKYPGKTTSCGKAFCNTRREVGSFVCDGTGGCTIELAACDMYACDEGKGACTTVCAGPADCQVGFYCNAGGQCVPRKVNGVLCTTDGECRTDHCSTGVCCNTDCATPFSCNTTGSVGQCKCPGVTCAAGVACQVFYQDADGDTFGNRSGTIAAATAKAGCAGAPPAGFVADNTDCDDGDANAKPGQTLWFNMASKGNGTWDYNCDGTMQKETPEYTGLSCKFCGEVGTCDTTTTACTAAGRTASYICPQELLIFKTFSQPVELSLDIEPHMSLVPPALDRAAAAPAAAPGDVVLPPGGVVLPPKLPQCCGCQAKDKTGFIQAVACGDATKYVYTCGSCAAVGGGVSASTRVLKQQQCH